ncbi:MAG: hypothetical protein ABI743_07815, partial [bacterium]
GIPAPVTYCAFQVDLVAANDPPTATVTGPAGQVTSGVGVLTLVVNPYNDPDSNPITFQFDWNNDGDYADTGEGALVLDGTPPDSFNSPIFYTNPGVTPESRSVPFKYTDGIIPTPITGTVGFTVSVPCPGLTYAGTNVSGTPFFTGNYYWSGFGGTAGWPMDSATWPTTAAPSTAFGSFVTQIDCTGIPGNPKDLVFMRQNLNWTGANPAGATSNFIMTNYGAAENRRIHQIEVDRTGRVVFAFANPAYPATSQRIPTNIYDPAQGTEAKFQWFDYTGVQVAPGSITTVSTGTGRIVALALDGNNDVYVIDHTHHLRKFTRASGYTEVNSAPFPMNLVPIIGADGGVAAGDANRKVIDFVVNFRNKNFFILTQSRGAAPNARLTRIECDGTVPATVAGNPNPALFTLNTDTAQAYAADMTIDQLDTTGAILATQGEAQIVMGNGLNVTNGAATGGPAEFRYWNTNMVNYLNGSALNANGDVGTITYALNNYVFTQYQFGTQWMLMNPQPLTGWQ